MKKKLRITVKGQTYDVIAEILDEDHPAAPPTANVMSGSASADATPGVAAAVQPKATVPVAAGSGEVPCPIAGTVVSVAKPVGSQVAVGDVVVVLEAMKMNTEVTAPVAGKVTAVNINPGQTVEEGQVLMTIA